MKMEMDTACSTHGTDDKCLKIIVGGKTLRMIEVGRHALMREDIIKMIIKRMDSEECTGLNRPNTELAVVVVKSAMSRSGYCAGQFVHALR